MGIAIDKGFIKDVNQKVYSFFSGYRVSNNDNGRQDMTIKNLLEMKSGFDCNEWTDDGKDCEDNMVKTADWVKFSLNLPMKNKPGTVWAYTSCNPMIISGIISNATHLSIMGFAKKYLFAPMGITNYKWPLVLFIFSPQIWLILVKWLTTWASGRAKGLFRLHGSKNQPRGLYLFLIFRL